MKHHTIKFANWLEKLNDWSSILTVSSATAIFVIVVVLLLGLKRRKFLFFKRSLTKANLIKNQTNKKSIQTHYWFVNDLFSKPTYCNVCETVMVSGVSCIYCNLYADEKCLKRAEKMFKCKQMCECTENDSASIKTADEATGEVNTTKDSVRLWSSAHLQRSTSYTKPWQHHWLKGNLKLSSVCFFCNENSGVGPNLNDFKCAWCQRTAHEKCLNSVSTAAHDECDFGDYKRLILKPNFLYLSKKQSTNITMKDININREIVKSAGMVSNWTPLFVFANPKSGNNDAELIVSHMTTVLNPLQIIEINKKNLDMILKWIEEYSDTIQFKLLVCGGDGSVGWLLESISKCKFKVRAHFRNTNFDVIG
jgi:diacylglycerol kinase (ATP)